MDNIQNLVALDDLEDYKVHEDDTDIRGWDLHVGDEKVGEVESLIANTQWKKVHYVEVELEDKLNSYRTNAYRNSLDREFHSFYGDDDDLRIIIPIGRIEIDRENERVVVSPNLTLQDLSNSPRIKNFSSTPILPIHELIVAKYFTHNDDLYRKDYEGDDYNLSQFKSFTKIPSERFYNTNLFESKRRKSTI